MAPRHVDSPDDCFFYHTMDLPGFGLVRGHWDLRGRFRDYLAGVEVLGKSVLDIGTATGFLSFEAEKHGARRVVSHDMSHPGQQTFVPFARKAPTQRIGLERWHNAYWLCHRLLKSRAEVYHGDIYDLPKELGAFEVVIVGAVLEHLSDPVKALGSIARLAADTIVVVTPLVDLEDRVAFFEPRADNSTQDYTWWTYSTGLYKEILSILGFRIERICRSQFYYEYGRRYEERATIVAVRSST